MDKESIYLLQLLDTNCNDCIFMERDFERFNNSLYFHKNLQLTSFNRRKNKLIEQANYYKNKFYDLEKWNDLLLESDKMKFVFDKSFVSLNFGKCKKLNKKVSYMPNESMLNANCFKHRKPFII